MKFSSDPELEGLIGRVCLIFARVEQEVGQVVMAAHGNWGVAMSADYLEFSSNSVLLFKWLKAIGQAYPEVKADTKTLSKNLEALKAQRDDWAHSAAIVDPFLMMKEQQRTSMSDRDIGSAKLLNAKNQRHTDAPSKADVDDFSARASDVGDEATALGEALASYAEDGIRAVHDPRPSRVRTNPPT